MNNNPASDGQNFLGNEIIFLLIKINIIPINIEAKINLSVVMIRGSTNVIAIDPNENDPAINIEYVTIHKCERNRLFRFNI